MSNGLKKSNTTLYIIIGFVVIVLFIMLSGTKKEASKPKHEEEIFLNATVEFDGKQFIIQNKDIYDWSNVKIDINPKLLSSGYSYNVPFAMAAGQIYTVGAMQFTKSDGERFNPFTHKPKKVGISGTIQGKRGMFFAAWE